MGKQSIYMKQNVMPLSERAANIAAVNLLQTLEKIFNKPYELEAIDHIKEYLAEVGCTSTAYQDLLETMLCYRSPAHVLAVELLLNKSFKTFHPPVDCACPERLAIAIAKNGTSLEFLDLHRLQLEESYWFLYEQILRNCRNLRNLNLPELPDNEFWLPLLDIHCPKLSHLTTPNIFRICNVAFASFKSTLTSILFSDYNFGNEEYLMEVAPILKYCPNIKEISPGIDTKNVLLHCSSENENFTCKLEDLHVTSTTEAILRTVISTCPNLQDLSLDPPKDGSLQILSGLTLKRLELLDFDMEDLFQLLRGIGHNLETLQLRCIYKKRVVNVCELLRLCPGLSKLKLVGANLCFEKNSKMVFCLKKFLMYHCQYDEGQFVNFLSLLQHLEEFYVDEILFTDNDMQRIFCQYPLKQFESFFVRRARHLTIRSVYVLLDFCPNLKHVCRLSRWNISPEDIKSIKCLKEASDQVYWNMYCELYNG